jgi:hypothetical protein
MPRELGTFAVYEPHLVGFHQELSWVTRFPDDCMKSQESEFSAGKDWKVDRQFLTLPMNT